MKNIISIIIKDRFGALSRIIELFSSRGYNLESICSGECEIPNAQRLTLVVTENENKIEKIIRMLNGFIDVIEAYAVDPETSYSCELMLIKVKNTISNKKKPADLIKSLKGEIIAQTDDCVSIEVYGTANYLNEIIEAFRPYGIVELARTGEAAIHC